MPTRAGWATALAGAAALVCGRLLGVVELFLLGAIAVAVVLAAVAWVRRPVPPMAVDRQVSPPRPTVGSPARVEVGVRRLAAGRTPLLTVVEPVEGTVGVRLALQPRRRQDPDGTPVGYRLPTRRRGLLLVGPTRVDLTDPFGLARRTVASAPARATLVLPHPDQPRLVRVGGGRDQPLSGATRRSASALGAEDLVTLRPYVVGDDLRRVHWPSSARTDELQVRRDEERWQGQVVVILDTARASLDPERFEAAVSAAAGLVWALAAQGDRVQLRTTGGDDLGSLDARLASPELLEHLALVAQHEGPDAVIPAPEPGLRRVLLTGCGSPAARRHPELPGDVLVVFDTHENGDDRTIAVAPGSTFADAWDVAASRSPIGGRR